MGSRSAIPKRQSSTPEHPPIPNIPSFSLAMTTTTTLWGSLELRSNCEIFSVAFFPTWITESFPAAWQRISVPLQTVPYLPTPLTSSSRAGCNKRSTQCHHPQLFLSRSHGLHHCSAFMFSPLLSTLNTYCRVEGNLPDFCLSTVTFLFYFNVSAPSFTQCLFQCLLSVNIGEDIVCESCRVQAKL